MQLSNLVSRASFSSGHGDMASLSSKSILLYRAVVCFQSNINQRLNSAFFVQIPRHGSE